ncbi:MAG TPA: DUF4105 domain-containing protein [Candidatus Limnocylindria bacterium]|nr:DUF4105 domain-containing protein [Candidatus Limnocylindria bacterium]
MIRRLLLALAGLALGGWCAAALWFDGPSARPVAGVLAAVVLALSLWLPQRSLRGLVAAGMLWAGVVMWWSSLAPSNARDWLPDVAHPPTATFRGHLVTVHNVRNFTYRSETDYTPHWETRTYDLDRIVGLDIFLSTWGSPYIAHTIMSWEFASGPPLAISIETRKERGEQYSAVRGFFRQYELYYVVADERDVIGLRAAHRGERVSLYRLAVPPEVARRLLVAYLGAADQLAVHPRWYNAFTHNCTTTIRVHVLQIGIAQPWDYRILVNGLLPEMFYERGLIDTELPLAEMLARSDVTERAKAADGAADFSARIREDLPPRP